MRQLVQVLVRKHLRPAFEGDEPRTIVHDYRVDAEYLPAYAGDRDCPPEDEGFDIAGIYHADERTPLALTPAQVAEIEEIMLANVHYQRDEEQNWAYRDRFTD
jgi:hypothetical protein